MRAAINNFAILQSKKNGFFVSFFDLSRNTYARPKKVSLAVKINIIRENANKKVQNNCKFGLNVGNVCNINFFRTISLSPEAIH